MPLHQIKHSPDSPLSSRQLAEQKYTKLWNEDPQKFTPHRNGKDSLRISKIEALISGHEPLENKTVADLGCGNGYFAKFLADKKAHVTAIDVCDQALDSFSHENIDKKKQYIPFTTLPDNAFDLVLALEIIAEIPPQEHRLAISEFARIIKPDGTLILSSELDIHTENPLEKLVTLLDTEFYLYDIVKSYHTLQIKLLNFFKKPYRLVKTNTSPLFLWKFLATLSSPFVSLLESIHLTRFLENITEATLGENGISHVIILGKRKPIFLPSIEEEQTEKEGHLADRKSKKIWE